MDLAKFLLNGLAPASFRTCLQRSTPDTSLLPVQFQFALFIFYSAICLMTYHLTRDQALRLAQYIRSVPSLDVLPDWIEDLCRDWERAPQTVHYPSPNTTPAPEHQTGE
jgi:hypothetical protein